MPSSDPKIHVNSSRRKSILAKVYAFQFLTDVDRLQYLASALETSREELGKELADLEEFGLVRLQNDLPKLTEKGRGQLVVVMAGGGFDIIHPGHIETLERARDLGDVLIVSVARNATFVRNKKRDPTHDEKVRKRLVSAIKCVDAAVLGSETDIFETVSLLKPDIIALGYDQAHSEEAMKKEIAKRGLSVKIVRLSSSVPEIKTSKILNGENGSLSDI